ncbi:MAG: hypothetical protein DDT32_02115 [Syntrophomonadaceae bacterium]|nr:hypothetical protein [Bacillota bacterium]MBT9148343.1 hypothetical protein [Bacillota bacterium]
MSKKRNRRIGSVKTELLGKSREAALAAVQIFNNPNITFKSETYIVLMIIAWTYLFHAYYRANKVEYRYCKEESGRRYFDKTKNGAYKYWELERCLNDKTRPISKDACNNLRFLIGLRHEIEHQMTIRIDDFLSARFQACCINYNQYIRNLFGDKYGIDKHLSFSLQFSSLSEEQVESMEGNKVLPKHIEKFIQGFDGELTNDEFNSPQYAYRVFFVAKTANRIGQADRVIEFVKADSQLGKEINAQYVTIKETERKKYLPSQIVKLMQDDGCPNFKMHQHTQLWKQMGAKNPGKGYGVEVVGTWYWYERWLDEVKKHCRENSGQYQ